MQFKNETSQVCAKQSPYSWFDFRSRVIINFLLEKLQCYYYNLSTYQAITKTNFKIQNVQFGRQF